MKRRFSSLAAIVMATAPLGAGAQAVALDHRELAADEQVVHALNRLTFGAKPGDVQRVRSHGFDRWVEEQLQPARISDRELEQFLGRYDVLAKDQNELLRDYAEMQQSRRQARQMGDTSRGQRRQMMAALFHPTQV